MGRLAPLALLALFLGFGAYFGTSGVPQSVLDARSAAVELALDDVPLRYGGWVAEVAPYPAEAEEILHTRALRAWRFSELGTGRIALLGIVYCGDVRDMNGHYPPVCYPAQGWRRVQEAEVMVPLEVGSTPFEARLWRFERIAEDESTERLSVLAFFLFPSAEPTSDVESIGERAARRADSQLGVAQLQLILEGWPDRGEVERLARDLLPVVPASTIRQLRGGDEESNEESNEELNKDTRSASGEMNR
ncbi:MAG: exosortase-associated EpsI family protein [Planctomycetota bacterium]